MDSNAQTAERSIPTQHSEDNDGETDLLKLWQTIWRRKWGILALVLVVAMVTTLAVLSVPPTYRAGATLLIEQKQANVVSIEQVYGLEGQSSEYLQTQFELLKSRSLAERVVKQLGLTTHPELDPRQQPEPLIDVSGLLDRLSLHTVIPATLPEDLEDGVDPAESQILDEVTKAFMARISTYLLGKSQLVRVEVDMADPRMAAKAANALANGFIESRLEANMDMAMTASKWMNSRLGELRNSLKNAEDRLQAYREKENLVDVDGVTTISAGELSRTGDRMIDARRQRAEAESQYHQVQAMRGSGWERMASVPAVLGHPLIQQFKAEEARAKAKVDELSKRYGDRHPVMEAARADLSAASGSLRGQVEQVVAGIERNYQLAIANERSLQTSFNTNKTQIQNIARKEFELRELQREVDANRALYDTFMTRLKETTATSDMESINARVIDPAIPPNRPIKPRKVLIVAMLSILALLAGVGITLVLEALNNTFKSPDEVESKLNLPVLGILPLVRRHERKEIAHLFSTNEEKAFSESIRTIRTGVVLSAVSNPHKILVITSSLPGEGKSTVAANLAMALGQMEKVLLLDADLRRPTQAKNFDFPVGTPGLANLIAGTAKLDECIKHVDSIDILGAGSVPPNPLELVSSPRLEELIEELRNQYDRIVIDSPPSQAVSDATMLALHANALIYVVKSESTPIPQVRNGIGQLLQSNAPVTGVVLNQVDMKRAQKYGYSYSGYYDYYGYSSGGQKT